MKNIVDFYPLSPMQQGMLFHSLAAPDSGVYVEQLTCSLKGPINIAAFRRAWVRVVERHPILRTAFLSGDVKEPVQVVYRAVELEVQDEDWSAASPQTQEKRLQDYLESERRRGFTLSKPPLMRLALFRLEADTHLFAWNYHHILLDGWSMPLVFQEVLAFYQAFSQNRDLLLDLPPSYRDYIVWLKRQDSARAEAYWRSRLVGFLAPTPLVSPRAKIEQAEAEERYEERDLWLPQEKARRLQTLARQHSLTLNTLVSAAWALLLSRYSGEDDICYGATVSGRPADLPGSEGMIGLFINTLPVRAIIDAQKPVFTWLQEFQTQLSEMRQYEYSSLVDIQGWSAVSRREALFETILVYENYPTLTSAEPQSPTEQRAQQEQRSQRAQLDVEQIHSVEQTNYPLTAVSGAADELMLKLVYDCRLFDAGWIERMLAHWANLLEGLANALAKPTAEALIGKLDMLSQAERQQVLFDWNSNIAPFPADRCAYQLFEEQAAHRPDAPALEFAGLRVSYAELNRQANQIAHHLIGRGVRRETMVGLCLERSVDMIAAMLGVMKAGGAYIPLDPTYPAERLAFMIEDSGVEILLTHSHLIPQLPPQGPGWILLDTTRAEIAACSTENPPARSGPACLAYVIYTSGSTGRPKGVLLEHHNLCNMITQFGRYVKLEPGSRVLQFFSYSFDVSVAEIFMSLAWGATLVLCKAEQVRPGPGLVRLLKDLGITHKLSVPSAVASMPYADLPALQTLVVGGEAATPELIGRWFEGRQFINAYGPTENTIISSVYEIKDLEDPEGSVSIGWPIPNTTLYILDRSLNPVPADIAGEIYLGGEDVARGYLNRPELTSERFIPDPFSAKPGARLYRTGDLGCFREDGSVKFLGRTDDQVKIRGFRVELGEIEAAMGRHPAIAAAAMRAIGQQLIAYVVPTTPTSPSGAAEREDPADPQAITLAEIRAFLRASLPEYMLPGGLVLLNELPLSPSGKVNRNALPNPENDRSAQTTEFVAPRDEIEAQLCRIWEEVLQVRPIGVQDNFFDLGGHSLLAVRVMAQINEKLGKELDLVNLFQAQTIEALANALRTGSEIALAVDGMTREKPALAWDQRPASPEEEDLAESPIIPLQKQGEQPPIYFIHPSGGSTHWYTDLAAALGKEQPFYAFQAFGMKGDHPIHITIEAMADYYTRALRKFQPHGPYQLGSWSLGVIIAYEMAQRLQQQGEVVSLLAMLDQGPQIPAAQPSDLAEYLVQTFEGHIALDVNELRKLPPDEQTALVYEKGKKAHFILPGMRLKDFQQFIHILHTQTQAWRNYHPVPYPGKITLFRAVEQDHPANQGRDLGWGELALGGVEVCDVPGDHLTMIHKPHVRKLAAAMKQQMKEASYG